MDWLESVPVIGKILQAVVRTVQAIRRGRVEEVSAEPHRSPHDSALAAVRALLEFGPLEPRLVITDSLDRGDSEDLAGASALIRRLPETRTLFLAAVRTVDGRPPELIGDLILEAERLGRAVRIELPPLSTEQIEEAVAQAVRDLVPPDWAAWLTVQSRGNPGRLWSLLGELEQAGQLRRAGRRWVWAGSPPELAPAAQTAESRRREWPLSDADRRLLALAVCEGPVFHSAVLAELAEASELEVEDRLSALCRLGLLEYRGAPQAGGEMTSRYAFRNPADAQALAGALSEDERAELAARIEAIRRELGL